MFEMDCLKRTLERKGMVSTKVKMNRKEEEGSSRAVAVARRITTREIHSPPL